MATDKMVLVITNQQRQTKFFYRGGYKFFFLKRTSETILEKKTLGTKGKKLENRDEEMDGHV